MKNEIKHLSGGWKDDVVCILLILAMSMLVFASEIFFPS